MHNLDKMKIRALILLPPLFMIIIQSLIILGSLLIGYAISQVFIFANVFFSLYLLIGLFIILRHDFKYKLNNFKTKHNI